MKNKGINWDTIIERAISYLQTFQNMGGCDCGRKNCPINLALYLMEECQIPVEKVAEVFVFWQVSFLAIICSLYVRK